jgi:biopolymer transport protein ExbD
MVSSCLPTKDSNLSNDPAQKEETKKKEPIQKLSQIELSIDPQRNVSHNDSSIGTLSNTAPISEFLLSNLNYDVPDRPKVVLNIDPSTPYSVVNKAILGCVAAKLQSVVFVGSEVTVSLPTTTAASTPPPEFPSLVIHLEIRSSGQVIADGLPKDSPLDEEMPQLASYFFQRAQSLWNEPNSKISIKLDPDGFTEHKCIIKVFNALSIVNSKIDELQKGWSAEYSKRYNTVFFKDASPFGREESKSIETD